MAQALQSGSVWVWKEHSDHHYKHAAMFGGEDEWPDRWGFVMRWVDDVRMCETRHPHRNMMHGSEGWEAAVRGVTACSCAMCRP